MARVPRKVFCTIQGSPIYEDEARTLMLCIFGVPPHLMHSFLGETLDRIKKMKAAMFIRLNVANVSQLSRKAQLNGFDIYGNYYDVPVFTTRELKLLAKMYPWIEQLPGSSSAIPPPPGPAL
jgi:hypothetical protein